MNRMILACAIGALAVVTSAPAGAARPPQAGKETNLDQKVCEDITIVGSRLAVKRVCATRAQWAEKRRRDRDAVDQAQRSPCVRGSVSGGQEVCGSY